MTDEEPLALHVTAGRDSYVAGHDITIIGGDGGRAASRDDVVRYLTVLADWLDADSWPQDSRFAGPELTPAAVEQRLRITDGTVREERDPRRVTADGLQEWADDLAERCTRLVALGGPGAGKTWFAKRTARRCAVAALAQLRDGVPLEQVELPLFTSCASLARVPGGTGIRRAVVASALGLLPDVGGRRMEEALSLVFEERDEHVLLVLDSLDEAAGDDQRVRLAGTLPGGWRIVLTSRPGSWNGQLPVTKSAADQRVGELLPLRYPEDVQRFIGRWFAGEPERAAALQRQLHDRRDLQDESTIPLILAMYCILGGTDPLPARRKDLYRKVVTRMLTGRWRNGSGPAPDPESCLAVLGRWAWESAASDPVSGLGAWLDEFPASPARLAPADLAALDHVAAPAGPPDPDTGRTVRRFVHRSVCEYLVADYVARELNAQQAAEELLRHLWHDRDWSFAGPAALAMHPDRDVILREILSVVTGTADLDPEDLAAVDADRDVHRFVALVAVNSAEADKWSSQSAAFIGRVRIELALAAKWSFPQELVAADWPTSNRVVRAVLISKLPLRDQPSTEQKWLVSAIASALPLLDPTEEDRALARITLLRNFSTYPETWDPESLTEPIARSAVSPQERDHFGEDLLRMLTTRAEEAPRAAQRTVMVQALAKIAVSAAERHQARRVIMDMLAEVTDPRDIERLGTALAALEPVAEEREFALGRLAETSTGAGFWNPWWMPAVTQAVVGLARTGREKASVVGRLLGALQQGRVPVANAFQVAQVIGDLSQDAAELGQARDALFDVVAADFFDSDAFGLAESVVRIAVTPEERARTRCEILRRFLSGPESVAGKLAQAGEPTRRRHTSVSESQFQQVAQALVALGPTADERAQARWGLMALLNLHWNTWDLISAVAALDPDPPEQERLGEALLPVLLGSAPGALDRSRSQEDRWPSSLEALKAVELAPQYRAAARMALLRNIIRADRNASNREHELMEFVARLGPTSADTGFLCQNLREAVARHSNGFWDLMHLAQSAAILAKATGDEEPVRRVLLDLLTSMDSPVWGRGELTRALLSLNPTADELDHARAELLRVHQQTISATSLGDLPRYLAAHFDADRDPEWTCGLCGTLAALRPTAADLAGCDTWRCTPGSQLREAVRRNSTPAEWLALLPSLNANARRRPGC